MSWASILNTKPVEPKAAPILKTDPIIRSKMYFKVDHHSRSLPDFLSYQPPTEENVREFYQLDLMKHVTIDISEKNKTITLSVKGPSLRIMEGKRATLCVPFTSTLTISQLEEFMTTFGTFLPDVSYQYINVEEKGVVRKDLSFLTSDVIKPFRTVILTGSL